MIEIIIGLSGCFVLIGVGIGWWILDGGPKQEARNLQNKFAGMGDLRGKTRAQIEAVVGKPQSWAAIAGTKSSATWNAKSHRYLITLQFDGDICEGVTSEITV